MTHLLRQPGVRGLLFAQTQVAFTDNAAKLLLIGLVQILLPADDAAWLVSAIALLMVAPFVLCAPLSGWLADRFPKRSVLAASLWLQLGVVITLSLAVAVHSIPLAVGGFFLLGLQSAVMAPARRGMARELAGGRVGELVGWMEMLCIAAILLGSVAGGRGIDGLTLALGGEKPAAWTAGIILLLLLAAGCVVALVSFRHVPGRPAASNTAFSAQAIVGHFRLLKLLRRDRGLWRAAWGDAMFYLAGGVLLLTLSEIGRSLHPEGIGAAGQTGVFLAVAGGGIALGSLLAARLSRKGIQLGLAPLGAAGMAVHLFALGVAAPGTWWFLALLAGLGLSGGLFVVPLGAYLVDRPQESERGRILAASGLLSSVAGVGAVGVHAVLSGALHVPPAGQFVALGLLMLGTSAAAARLVPQHLLRTAGLLVARCRYAIRTVGNLPDQGGALVICNHVSYVDTLALSLASSRPIRFLAYEEFFRTPVLGLILRVAGAIPVSPTRAKDAIVRAAEALRSGEIVCIFPEGQLTRTGCLMELRSGFEIIARRAGCPVHVAHLDGLWGSIHSFAGGRYFTKWPRGWRRQVTVSFRPLDEISTRRAREVLLELGEAAWRQRTFQDDHLGQAVFRQMERNPFRTAVIDPSSSHKSISNLELLSLAWRLARRWRAEISDVRVGVILPPGIPGTLANLALVLAGKIPVNLNPTLGREAAASCLDLSGVRTIITAEPVQRRLTTFPWTDRIVRMEDSVATLRSGELLIAALQLLLLPRWILEMRQPWGEADREAVLLFTSGTSGLPKGVALTHGNILANFRQIAETSFLAPDDRILSPLPLFHSFGLTMGLFFPLLAGRTVIAAPSPLDCEKIAEAGRAGSPTILLSTPTFLRTVIRRVPRDAFGTLRLAVAGAERLPAETAAAFHARFGCPVLEGYGMTEASPVLCINVPHPALGPGAASIQTGHRDGSVGRLLPGIAFRLTDPATGAPASGQGLMSVRASNLVAEYLGGAEADRFQSGWFETGDIVRIDAEGFVFIEGRSSRFSKIGGEMISHAAVECALSRTPAPEGHDCVLGLPCPEKGERLVLLTTRNLPRESLREILAGHIPNLWIPRELIRLERLPTLASGKLDLAECRRIATLTFAQS